MSNRYYQRDYEELYYIIDSEVISEEEFDEKVLYDGYSAFSDSLTGEEIVNLLNENEQLKSELKKIYDITTVNKVKTIIEKIYDDLLYETSEESNYERKIVLKCLEKIDDFGDDLE